MKNNKQKIDVNLNLVANKYFDVYDESFEMYDARLVFYPMYKTKVTLRVAREVSEHPLVLCMLEMVEFLSGVERMDVASEVKKLTCLEDEIFGSIWADLTTRGLLVAGDALTGIRLSESGKELLEKKKSRVEEERYEWFENDGIFGRVFLSDKKDDLCGKADESGLQLNAGKEKRMRLENLDEVFDERANLSLKAALNQAFCLGGGGESDGENVEVDSEKTEKDKDDKFEIVSVEEFSESKKLFRRYFALFFKNKETEERIYVLNDKLEYDENATNLFDELLKNEKFDVRESRGNDENADKFEKFEFGVCLDEGSTIDTKKHPIYLKYALKEAKQSVCIHSPWVRGDVLEKYENDIKNALERGVKVRITYGLKKRSRHDKPCLDESGRAVFERLKKCGDFAFKEIDSHEKVLICDDEFMVVGSFNWLSFGGEDDKNGEVRGEMSSVSKNKKSIKEKMNMFKF